VDELERQLEGDVPEGLSVLDAGERAALAEVIRETRQHQSEALRSATDRALDKVPALLRGPVRRLLS
jgi:hypothetical protein